MAIARARPTRLRMPPDSDAGFNCSTPLEPDPVQPLRTRWRISASASCVVLAQRQRHVLAHRHRVEQRRALEQHAEPRGALRSGRPPRSPTISSPSTSIEPASGSHEPDDVLEQDALAGAARPEHHHGLAVADVEVDAVEHRLAARSACAARGSRSCHRSALKITRNSTVAST